MPFWSRPDPPPAKSPDPPAEPASGTLASVCGFCEKDRAVVRYMVATEKVAICDECVATCAQVVAGQEAQDAAPPDPGALADALVARVVGHDAAIRALVAEVRLHAAGMPRPVLIVGPPGCGKSTLVQALRDARADLPSVRTALHRITATGYVGEDMESVLVDLLNAAGGVRSRAERGLAVLEDLHQLAHRPVDPGATRDVTGAGVQRALIRLVGGEVCHVRRGPVHPFTPNGEHFRTAGLHLVLTATLDLAPDADVREALVAAGLLPDLIDRIPRIVVLQRRPAVAQEQVLRRHLWPEAVQRLAALGVPPPPLPVQLPHRAATGRGGWTLAHAVAALEGEAIAG